VGQGRFRLKTLPGEDRGDGFNLGVAETMQAYQYKATSIREISIYGPMVFAKSANGTVLIPLPMDHAIWTERAGQRVPVAMAAYKAANPDDKKYEAWVMGTVSKLAREQMSKLGVQTVERVGKQIDYIC
jgi:hypothetical protein